MPLGAELPRRDGSAALRGSCGDILQPAITGCNSFLAAAAAIARAYPRGVVSVFLVALPIRRPHHWVGHTARLGEGYVVLRAITPGLRADRGSWRRPTPRPSTSARRDCHAMSMSSLKIRAAKWRAGARRADLPPSEQAAPRGDAGLFRRLPGARAGGVGLRHRHRRPFPASRLRRRVRRLSSPDLHPRPSRRGPAVHAASDQRPDAARRPGVAASNECRRST
jgi:hypothetical protein